MQRIPPEALAAPYIRKLAEQFPDIDEDILTMFLEEVNYNCDEAAALIREEAARYAQFAEDPEGFNVPTETLQAEFPSASPDQIEFLLEAYPDDIEQVRQSLSEIAPAHNDPEFNDEIQELPRYQNDPEFNDEVQELQYNPGLEALADEFPNIERVMLNECLQAAGSLILARQWILEQFPEARNQSRRKQKQEKQVIQVFHEVPKGPPRGKKEKRKKNKHRSPFAEPKRDPVEELVAFGFNRERAIEALQLTGGDVERAANMMLEDTMIEASEPAPQTPAELLHSWFVSTPLEEIEEVLEQVQGDVEHAASILGQRLSENPPLEDSVLALVPEVTVEEARDSLKRTRGDVRKAAALAFRYRRPAPPKRPAPKKKILTVDLHGYTSREAYSFVSRAVRRARESGDVRQINFITGRGLHSKNGPVLRPLVCQLCRKLGTNAFIGPNPGVVVCNFDN